MTAGDAGDTVLVLRALGLGDLLTGVAALRGVRQAWPGHRVLLAGGGPVGDWLVAQGVADEAVRTRGLEPLRWRGAGHVAVNLHGRGPQSHRVLQEAGRPRELVAFDCPEAGHAGPVWDADEHEVLRWCRLIGAAGGRCGPEGLRLDPPDAEDVPGGGGAVVLHPGAASGARRWPAARWAAVARRLAAEGHRLVLTGGPQESGLCTEIAARVGVPGGVTDLSGRLDLDGLGTVVARARLLVCGDTGVAHLATAYGTPSVLLFGPTPPRLWGPVLDPGRHTVLWHGQEGDPGDPHGTEPDPALLRVRAEEVLDACSLLLDSPPADVR